VDLEDAWFQRPACHRHPSHESELACARCGTFCCTECLDPASRGLCTVCGVVATHARRTREAYGVAWKLALGPALVAFGTMMLLAHHRDVPPVFAIWLAPLVCAFFIARTERAGIAWLGTIASLALIAWLGASVTYAEQYSRLIDVVMLSIGPLVAVPGCVRLTRVSQIVQLAAS
jgi:hypothetical protein